LALEIKGVAGLPEEQQAAVVALLQLTVIDRSDQFFY
jgi:hypothetical protein